MRLLSSFMPVIDRPILTDSNEDKGLWKALAFFRWVLAGGIASVTLLKPMLSLLGLDTLGDSELMGIVAALGALLTAVILHLTLRNLR